MVIIADHNKTTSVTNNKLHLVFGISVFYYGKLISSKLNRFYFSYPVIANNLIFHVHLVKLKSAHSPDKMIQLYLSKEINF